MAATRCSRPRQRIWGYETPDGSFAQFCRVQSRQLMARPQHLTWEEAACYTLTLATAYRMLFGHAAAHAAARRQRAGLGRLGRARRLRRAALRGLRRQRHRRHLGRVASATTSCGSAPRASSTARTSTAGASCPRSTRPNTTNGPRRRASSARRSGTSPARRTSTSSSSIRARQTFPVSTLVVKRGGMVVFCAGTSGFNLTFDARYVWMRQKRIQGSHFAHLKQAAAANQFVIDRRIDPCMSRGLPLGEDPARPHQDVEEPARARATWRCWSTRRGRGLRTFDDVIEAGA